MRHQHIHTNFKNKQDEKIQKNRQDENIKYG